MKSSRPACTLCLPLSWLFAPSLEPIELHISTTATYSFSWRSFARALSDTPARPRYVYALYGTVYALYGNALYGIVYALYSLYGTVYALYGTVYALYCLYGTPGRPR